MIQALLRAKADPNLRINDKTPIEWCVMRNKVEYIKMIQKYGGDILHNEELGHGNSLHLACSLDDDHLDVIEYLIEQ